MTVVTAFPIGTAARAGGAGTSRRDDLRRPSPRPEGAVRAVNGVSFAIMPARRSASSASPARARARSSCRSWACWPATAAPRQRQVPGPGDPRPAAAAAEQDPRRADVDDLPGPDDLAESLPHGQAADDRGAGHAQGMSEDDAPPRRDRDAGPRADPRGRAAHRHVSARILRRHAPARDDRHGAAVPAGAADRRRADHGARRHGAGADPRPDERAEARVRHGAWC